MLLRRNLILKQSIRRRLSTSAPPPPPPPPPPPAPPKGGNNGLFLFLAIAGAGGAYYYQNELKEILGGKPSSAQKPSSSPAAKTSTSAPVASSTVVPDVVPSKEELTKLEKVLVTDANKKPKPLNWDDVRARVVELMDDSEWDDGSWGPVFVRLAWHAAGTYDTKTKKGGSDGGLMRFKNESEWGANAGLAHARARLEPLKREFPDASFADLWSFAGTVAIEEMGGPKMKWRPGRKDVPQPPKENLPDGLLPDADGRDKKENPADHLREIFGRQGFTDREIVALSGAHAMGRCHTDRSGYWGPWTRAPTTFSNDYFRLLLEEKWTPKKLHQGKIWAGPAQYEDKTGELMMLPTDLALVQDAKMRPIVEEYAKDEKKFFDDFAKAWIKLQENGVKSLTGTRRYYFFGPRE